MLPPPFYSEENIPIPSGFGRRIGSSRNPSPQPFRLPWRTLLRWRYENQTAFVSFQSCRSQGISQALEKTVFDFHRELKLPDLHRADLEFRDLGYRI